MELGVQFAVMPCCHKDHQGSMKEAAKSLGLPLGVVMDLALVGRIQAQPGYHCLLKTIDEAITPQNRIVVAVNKRREASEDQKAVQNSEEKMKKAYHRAHRVTEDGRLCERANLSLIHISEPTRPY
eukprot:TRINITY_DN49124_c0_g1_i1.p1 TRINITY_DN49124_c0_g1~~TRINITY_DN49124_c0_g1_i1.p1  ORF type:complete len:126 (-),score=14.02 TRINITY_DN49124_c0_g1_i1:35-412(-)